MDTRTRTDNSIEWRIALATAMGFLFALFLLGGALLAGCLGSEGGEFSPAENRYLAERPEVTAERILNGEAMKETEAFLDDHFPGRERWIEGQAMLEIASGRRESRGIYFASDEEEQPVLIPSFKTYDRERWTKNTEALERFASAQARQGRTVYVTAVPTAPAIYAWRLPHHAPEVNQGLLLQELSKDVPSAKVIDVAGALWIQARGQDLDTAGEGDLYFRTDHHMTQAGSYMVYREIAGALGLEPLRPGDFRQTVVTEDFRGTSCHKSGAFWLDGETMVRWIPKDADLAARQDRAKVTILPEGTEKTGLFDEAAAGEVDAYAYFLYGNQPLEVIRTGADADVGESGGQSASRPANAGKSTSGSGARKLLVVKDSYAHSIVPFLALHYDEIHMVDLRYYRGSLSAYLDANDIDTILVLYNLPNLAEDRDVPQIVR